MRYFRSRELLISIAISTLVLSALYVKNVADLQKDRSSRESLSLRNAVIEFRSEHLSLLERIRSLGQINKSTYSALIGQYTKRRCRVVGSVLDEKASCLLLSFDSEFSSISQWNSVAFYCESSVKLCSVAVHAPRSSHARGATLIVMRDASTKVLILRTDSAEEAYRLANEIVDASFSKSVESFDFRCFSIITEIRDAVLYKNSEP